MHAATPTATSVVNLVATFNCKLYKIEENAINLKSVYSFVDPKSELILFAFPLAA